MVSNVIFANDHWEQRETNMMFKSPHLLRHIRPGLFYRGKPKLTNCYICNFYDNIYGAIRAEVHNSIQSEVSLSSEVPGPIQGSNSKWVILDVTNCIWLIWHNYIAYSLRRDPPGHYERLTIYS